LAARCGEVYTVEHLGKRALRVLVELTNAGGSSLVSIGISIEK
jgi:hypothetical protein